MKSVKIVIGIDPKKSYGLGMIKKNDIQDLVLKDFRLLSMADGDSVFAFAQTNWLSAFLAQGNVSPKQARLYFNAIIAQNVEVGIFAKPRFSLEHRACGIQREYARHFGVLTDAVYGLIYAQKPKQFLLQRRSDDGLWDFSFSGAHCWYNQDTLQTLEDSLYQEAQEEVGINVRDLSVAEIIDLPKVATVILDSDTVSYEVHHRRIITVDDATLQQATTDGEALTSKWFDVEALLSLAHNGLITPKVQYLLLTAISEVCLIDKTRFIAVNQKQFDYYHHGEKTDFQSYGTLEDILFKAQG